MSGIQHSSLRRPVIHYSLALGAIAAGFLLRLGLTAWVGPGLPTFITFYPAVMVAALLAGLGPGLVVTALTALTVALWIHPLIGHPDVNYLEDAVALGLFSIMGAFMSVFAELYRRARPKAEAYDKELALRESQEALRCSEAILRAVTDNAPDAVFLKDRQSRLLMVNPAVERIVGKPAAEMLGQHDGEIYSDPAIGRAILETDRRIMERGETEVLEETVQTSQGYRVFLSTKSPWRDAQGRVTGLIGIARDITERKLAEEHIRRAADFNEAAMRSLGEGLYTIDEKGLVTSMNPAAEQLFGWTFAELRGKKMHDMTHHHYRDGRPFPCAECAGFQVLTTGTPLTNHEDVFIRKDGNFFDVIYSIAPLRDATGKINGLVVVFSETTERKRAEAALEEARRSLKLERDLLRSVMNGARNAHLVFLDRDFNFVRVNETYARTCGYTPEEMVGKNHFALYPHAENQAIFARVRDTGEPAEFHDKPFVFPDQPERGVTYWDWTLIPVKDDSGTVQGLVFSLFETTDRKRAGEALRRAKEEWERTFDSVPDLIAILDGNHRILRANRAMAERLGFAPEKCVGQICYRNVHCAEHPPAFCPHAKTMADGREHVAEIHEPRLGGDFLISTTPLSDEQGRLIGSVHVARDITERKRIETALRESEERLAAFATASIEGIVLSERGRIVDCNAQFARMTGWEPGELKGRPIAELVAPEDRQRVSGNIQASRDSDVEHVMLRRDGSRIVVEAHGRQVETGARRYTVVLDITERRKREDELRRLNRTLRALSNSNQALMRAREESEFMAEVCQIIVQDCGHSMVWIGFAEEDDAKTVRPVAHAGFEEGYLKTLDITWADTERGRGPTGTAIRTGKPAKCTDMLSDPRFAPWRGEAIKHRFASSIVFPLLAGDKAFGALTIYSKQPDPFSEDEAKLLSELTDDLARGIVWIRLHRAQQRAEAALRQTAQELERSNRDLEQFAYVASHDLQEPLRAVSGYVELLRHRFPEKLDARANEYVAGAVDGALRMQRLITDLLAFSRVTTQGGDFTSTDMNALLDGALANLQMSLHEARATVTHDPLPALRVDAAQIVQLFQNLIGNAVKFHSERAPEIHVGVRQEKDGWLFWVRDNGIGIEPQYFERIFQVFQRLHTRKRYPGTGIGLAICKKIVERHGGAIWIESQPGEGSTFYFSIPETSAKKEPVI